MSSTDPERRREVNRDWYRHHRARALDAELEAAALYLGRAPSTAAMDNRRRCIAYLRVYNEEPPHPDYDRQTQQQTVERITRRIGARLIDTYEELEKRRSGGGGRQKRPELARALAHCQEQGATLIIAKLGHLVDSAPLLSQLAASAADGVEFVCCDKSKVNHENIRDLAIAANCKERTRTDQRRAAWIALKERGYRHAHMTPENTRRYAAIMAESVRAESRKFLERLRPYFDAARRNGWTLTKTAETLNTLEITTRRGCEWNFKYVHAARKRAASLPPPSETEIALAAKQIEDAAAAISLAASAPAKGHPAAEAVGAPPVPATAQPPKKKRGPAPALTQAITARMRAEISEGTLTAEQLDGIDEEALAARYNASRYTVRVARKAALSL